MSVLTEEGRRRTCGSLLLVQKEKLNLHCFSTILVDPQLTLTLTVSNGTIVRIITGTFCNKFYVKHRSTWRIEETCVEFSWTNKGVIRQVSLLSALPGTLVSRVNNQNLIICTLNSTSWKTISSSIWVTVKPLQYFIKRHENIWVLPLCNHHWSKVDHFHSRYQGYYRLGYCLQNRSFGLWLWPSWI